MEYAYHVFLLLGGIALFLFGINYMGAALEQAAGDNLRSILQKLTNKPYMAVIVGAVVTAVIQSSGATMVMAVGFVNAQLMTLSQALYVMLGAAIGTTITAQIIAFDIDPLAPLILFIGLILFNFIKNRKVKKVGAIILGFGLLFMGIYLMGEAIGVMDLGNVVEAFLNNVSNPVLAFLFGFIFTFIIQSSSASVGILQVLTAGALAESFSLNSVVYIILGMNVGAVAPLVISSLGSNRAAKRATIAQVTTKLLGAAVFVILILVFPNIITWIENMSDQPSRQIANLHLIFNIISSVSIFPLISLVTKTMMKVMPDSEEYEFNAPKLLYITDDLSKAGASAMIAQAHKEITRFATISSNNLKDAVESFFTLNEETCKKVLELENTINYLNHELNVYLIKINSYELTEKESDSLISMFNVITDFERIGDHAENIAEYVLMIKTQGAKISASAMSDLRRMADQALKSVSLAVQIFETQDASLLQLAEDVEQMVDDFQDELINNHIERLQKNICDPRGGVIYTDLVSDLERCSDHAINVSESILDAKDAPIEHADK